MIGEAGALAKIIEMAGSIMTFLIASITKLINVIVANEILLIPFTLTMIGMVFVGLRFFVPRFMRK